MCPRLAARPAAAEDSRPNPDARLRTEFAAEAGMRQLLMALVFALGTASPALAVSLNDLIGLSRAGLSDDILIALVESERSVFHLDAEDVKELKGQGLSDRLILHLLSTRTLREEAARQAAFEQRLEAAASAPIPPAPPAPQDGVIDRVGTLAGPV
mgnify:FL=1